MELHKVGTRKVKARFMTGAMEEEGRKAFDAFTQLIKELIAAN